MKRKIVATVLAAYVATVAALLVLYACTGCGVIRGATAQRSVIAEYDSAVGIEVVCMGMTIGYGSGVIVSPSQVLTAAHVVATPGCEIQVHTAKGDIVPMVLEASAPAADVARLATKELYLFNALPFTVAGPPDVGDDVCLTTAWPVRGRRCGQVQRRRSLDGQFFHDAVTEPGNSGSGAYDTAGRLVGIVVTLHTCRATGQICGGGISPLADIMWILPGSV